jgi:hypothetical protein
MSTWNYSVHLKAVWEQITAWLHVSTLSFGVYQKRSSEIDYRTIKNEFIKLQCIIEDNGSEID